MSVSCKKTLNDATVEEEDWSDIMTPDVMSGGFSQHEMHEFQLGANGPAIQIASAPALTPLDMIDLSWGTHDATGHKIWTGALFFLQILSLQKFELQFSKKRIIELGAGSGLSGIAVSKLYQIERIVLTDSSDSALDLCRLNCSNNQVSTEIVQVEKLCWGEILASSLIFDSVLATDILYDLQSWEPLLKTAYASLKDNGTFVLSHVPRAALPEELGAKSLESYLVDVAQRYHFCLLETHQPRDFAEKLVDWSDMEQSGASIFVFQKKAVC